MTRRRQNTRQDATARAYKRAAAEAQQRIRADVG